MRKYKGNAPSGDEWQLVGEAYADNVVWLIYEKAQDKSDEWFAVKVIADGFAFNKANYWTAVNKQTGQITMTRDMRIMEANRPELLTEVMAVLDGRTWV